MDYLLYSILNLIILILIVSVLIVFFTYISWKYLRSDISFDEMLAEKKKLREGLTAPLKKKPIKKPMKKKDRSPHVKIAKEPEAEPEPEGDSESDTLSENNSTHENEINIQLQKPIKNAPVKKPKSKTGILVNKDEPVLISNTPEVVEANHFEKSHPKDSLEIHREAVENKENKEIKEKPIKKTKKVEEVPIVKKKKVEVQQTVVSESTILTPSVASDEETEIATLIRTLNKAELTRSQIQILIDFLLNKQQDTIAKEPTEWSEGKSDVVQKLKKQLSEKEELLKNEQVSVAALTAKLKELRNEYNTEKAQFNATLKAHLDEIHAKSMEIRNLSQTHANEKQSLTLHFQQNQQKLLQMKEENMKTIQQLTESNNCLHQQIMFSQQHDESVKSMVAQKENELCILKQELQNIKEIEKLYNLQKCEFERKEESNKIEIKNLQNVLKEKELKLSEYQEHTNSLLQEKVKEYQEQIEQYKEKNNELRTKNWKLVNALQTNAEPFKDNNQIQNQLKEKEIQLADCQKQMENLIKEKNELQQQFDEFKQNNRAESMDKFIQHEQKIVKNSDRNGHDHENNSSSKDNQKEIEILLQNAQLKTMLKQTEDMLKNLENKVVEQEAYWKDIVQLKDNKISELRLLQDS